MFPVSPAWMKSQLYCTMGVVVFLRNCSRLLLAHLLLLCCIIRQCSHPSAEIVCMTWAVLSNPLGQSQTHGDLVQHTPAQKGVKCDFWLKKKKKCFVNTLFLLFCIHIYSMQSKALKHEMELHYSATQRPWQTPGERQQVRVSENSAMRFVPQHQMAFSCVLEQAF